MDNSKNPTVDSLLKEIEFLRDYRARHGNGIDHPPKLNFGKAPVGDFSAFDRKISQEVIDAWILSDLIDLDQ
jgi:hypothetical protein